MPILTVSIAFDPARHAWVVSRARTVVGTYATREDAIRGASAIAVMLRRRMHCDMRIKVHDGPDAWRTYESINDDRGAATMAMRLLEKFRYPRLRPIATGTMGPPRVPYIASKAGGGTVRSAAPTPMRTKT